MLFRQGLTSIADLPLLGHKQDDIRELLKGFNSLTEARGVPLSYVVRRGLPPGGTIDDIQDLAEGLIHETTHGFLKLLFQIL